MLTVRLNRGLGANNRQARLEAQEIARHQLKNKHWLVHFPQDNTCAVVPVLSNGVCLDLGERLYVKVSSEEKVHCFSIDHLFKFLRGIALI